MKRKFTLLAIATFVSSSLMAGWDGTKWTPEDGPYTITSTADLIALAAQVNDGNSFSGKTFIQTADLDLGGIQNADGTWKGTQWIPIGNNKKQFSGTYDGNGKVINNIYYRDSTKNGTYAGLFGGINNATLKNITVASGFLYGYQYIGGICGIAKGASEITYCANIATVYGKKERIGGIVAQIAGTTNVNNCINYGLISAFNFAGGVVGGREKSTTETVSCCINVGQVFTMRCNGNVYGLNNKVDDVYGPTSYCYYDNQINTNGGWTFNGTGQNTDSDIAGVMEGKSTTELTNESLNGFSTTVWEFTAGMYPRLKVNSGKDAIILAATPVKLNGTDKADNVTNDFTVSTANNVSWTSGNTSYLSLNNSGNATIKKSTAVVLTATKGGYTKKIYLKTNKSGATPIGSSESPLTIESEDELIKFRKAVNNYGTYKGCANYDGFKGIHFKVTIDIELNNWTEPIGSHNSFKGVFDGNHRTISGININQPSIDIVGGLFGCASYGEIKNISVSNKDEEIICGYQFVGGLCGSTFRETITNCIVDCKINIGKSSSYAGGIVGVDKGYSILNTCENKGNVSGKTNIGGIMATSNIGSEFIDCKNSGTIEGLKNDDGTGSENIGGICGSGGKSFINCENHGNIISLSKNSGGIVGTINNASEESTINGCINTGAINGADAACGIGGRLYNNIEITNCLNLGEISGTNISGICSMATGAVTVSNSFNAGKINATTSGNGISAGASCSNCINIGEVTNGKPISSSANTKCFFDNQLFTFTPPCYGSGLKTAQLVGTALQSDLGSNWTYTDYMYPMIKTLDKSNYMILAASTITLDTDDTPDNVNKKFHIGSAHSVEWKCDQANIVSFSSNNAYLSKPTTEDENVVVTVNVGKLEKSFNLTIKKAEDGNGLLQPNINWNLDNTIFTYGNKLTTAMQNATESHDYNGHFEYNFDENHFLSVGGHNLTATFIPAEEEENNIAVKVASIAITVSKATPTINWSVQNGLEIDYGTDAEEILKTAKATLNGVDVSDEGTFYYTIPTLTGGSKEIKVKFIGDNYESDEVTRTITVIPATPTIAWANPAPITYGTALSDLQLGAVSGVEGEFTYYAKNDEVNADFSPVAINAVLDAGTYTLKAVFDANSENYADGESMTVQLVVNKLKPEITWKDDVTFAEITYGGFLSNDFAAEVSAEFNGKGSIVYLENNQPINLWDENNPVSAGTHTITAQFEPSDPNYDTNTAVATVKINKATPVITWLSTDEERTVKYGTPLSTTQLNASVEPADAGTVRFALDAAGTNDAMGASDRNAGTCAVYAIIDESDNYNAAQTSKDIVINKADLTINWNPQGFTYGATSEEMANAIENAEVSFKGQKIEDGNFVYSYPSTLNAGKDQTVSVRFVPNSSNFNTVETTETIDIAKADPVLYWLPGHVTYGATDEDIENIIRVGWAIYNFVFVDGDYDYDIPQPLNVGIYYGVNLTFTPTGNDTVNFNSVKTTATIYVDKADPTITWTPSVAEITYGTTLSADLLNAEFSPADAVGEFVYTEGEDTIVASTILDAGAHTITATLPESDNYNSASTTATITVTKAGSEITWETPAAIAYGTPISAVELNATANVDGTFTYTLNGENAEGLTPEVGSYTIIANFTPTSTNYSGNSASVTLKVVSAAAEITWATPAAITYGTPISSAQLNATANTEGEFTYSVREGDVLTAGEDSIFVKFTPNSPDYGRAVDTVILVVNKANLTVSVADVTIKQGEALPAFELTYSGFVNNENESALTTAPVATCNATGAEAGTFDIIVSGGESANYNFTYTNGKLTVVEAPDTTTIPVVKKTPVITWADTYQLTYGAIVDSTILNAKADVEGAFAYSINLGDSLNAGEYTIIATFTPADSNYVTATDTAQLQVAKTTLVVSVADVTIKQGEAIPAFEIDYSGFKFNDNINSLTAPVVASSVASSNEAGIFDITLSGGQSNNYNFDYKNGKLTITAVEDTTAIVENEATIAVYPNPATDFIVVETNSNVENIFIYNIAGKLVKVEPNAGTTRIDISDVEQGTYIVKVGEKTMKLLKQ